MIIQNNNLNTDPLLKLTHTTHQTIRVICGVANRHRRMREHDLRYLVQAFVISRVVCSLPYLYVNKAEDKVNALIRQTYKSVRNLAPHTPTERLLAMCIHNTLQELVEAHRTAQIERFSSTPTSRHVQASLGLQPTSSLAQTESISATLKDHVMVLPLPKKCTSYSPLSAPRSTCGSTSHNSTPRTLMR